MKSVACSGGAWDVYFLIYVGRGMTSNLKISWALYFRQYRSSDGPYEGNLSRVLPHTI